MKIFFLLAILFFFVSANAQVAPEHAKDSIGKKISVCGMVDGAYSATSATFLNMGGQYPNSAFSAVIFKENLGSFTYSLTGLKGKVVCVTGTVELYKGKPQIIVRSPQQISIN